LPHSEIAREIHMGNYRTIMLGPANQFREWRHLPDKVLDDIDRGSPLLLTSRGATDSGLREDGPDREDSETIYEMSFDSQRG
jgi:hypothetical protein